MPFGCSFHCLATCDPKAVPYCIARALRSSYRGQMEDGYAMCGANAWRVDRVTSVKELVEELVERSRRRARPGLTGRDWNKTITPRLPSPS